MCDHFRQHFSHVEIFRLIIGKLGTFRVLLLPAPSLFFIIIFLKQSIIETGFDLAYIVTDNLELLILLALQY